MFDNKNTISRREFLKDLTLYSLGVGFFLSCKNKQPIAKTEKYDLAVAKNPDIAKAVRQSIDALGGMKQFISKGDKVLIKPNIGWARTPVYASNTNPIVVKTLVEMAFEAGASKVYVFDRPVQNAHRTYRMSGIEAAAKSAGAIVKYLSHKDYAWVKIKEPLIAKKLYLNKIAMDMDTIINVPVAKQHGLSRLTLAFKNTMGLLGGNRSIIHKDFSKYLVDLNKPFENMKLTVIDASKIMIAGGPIGLSVANVRKKDTIIASSDRVLADSYAMGLFHKKPSQFKYIKNAINSGMGKALNQAHIKKIA